MRILIPMLVAWLPVAALAAPAPEAQPPWAAAFSAALPPADLVDRALDAHPDVREAEAGLSGARAERTRLNVGPHEYIGTASATTRRTDDAGDFFEAELGLARTLRLGGKARLDRETGLLGERAAEDSVDDARHQAARALAELWFAWIEAEAAARVDVETATTFDGEHRAMRRRAELLDASVLEVEQSQAALAAANGRAAQSLGQARAARLALEHRYPELILPANPPSLPAPIDLIPDLAAWRDLVVNRSHEVRIAENLARRQESVAARARLDRKPDPTIGLRAFSERGGRETGLGIFVSRPFGGAYRQGAAEAEGARAAAAAAALLRVRREVAEVAAQDAAAVEAGAAAWRAAAAAAEASTAMARRMGRAYELGLSDLSDALAAQRLAADALRSESAARASAWRALALLRIDAHDLWAEHHDD